MADRPKPRCWFRCWLREEGRTWLAAVIILTFAFLFRHLIGGG